MNNKKIILSGILVTICITLIYGVIYSKQKKVVLGALEKHWLSVQNEYFFLNEYKLIKCDYHIWNSDVAFVGDSTTLGKHQDIDIIFYNLERFYGTPPTTWIKHHTGSSTVKNMSFAQAVKMTEEDCSQFQEDKSYSKDTDIYWNYGEYKPQPEETLQEIRERERKKIEVEMSIDRIKRGEETTQSTYSQLKESGISETDIQRIIQEIKDDNGIIYEDNEDGTTRVLDYRLPEDR